MTRSSEDNMNAVAAEANQMDVDYGKNFKILLPNDQIKGKYVTSTFSFRLTAAYIFLIFRASDDLARQEHQQK